jgi:CCR4-NOT transcription complex subunit 3
MQVEEAETQALREKHEAELKKEIKRLQKLRESIKGWTASSEVKNKQPLLDARFAIEKKMEAFKVLERHTKTKAYSRQGLAMAGELNPEEQAKKDARDFLTSTVSELEDMSDVLEAEIEQEMGKKRTDTSLVSRLVSRRWWRTMRMLAKCAWVRRRRFGANTCSTWRSWRP